MKTYLLIFTISSIISAVLGKIFIPLLKKLKFGQTILSYVKEHKGKDGTPTMGGLFIVFSAIIAFFILSRKENYLSIVAISIVLAFMLVGFIDDFIKIKNKQNQGLTPLQKIIFQLLISLIASIFAYKNGFDFVYLPYTKTTLYLGVFSIILNSIVFISIVNGVNLIDGLDGLCSMVSMVVFILLGVIISLEIQFNSETYVFIEEYNNLSVLSISFAGALFGYLLYNVYKASVFMGDTGSLALGGGIGAISVFSGNSLYIPLVGIMFVLTAISVIIQVIYYKKTKKRVFLMAPLHHHLQHKGYSESKISFSYFFVTTLMGIIILIFLM